MRRNVYIRFDNRTERQYRHERPLTLRDISREQVLGELREYIATHEEAGIQFDTEYQVFAYDECMTLAAKKLDGVWVIFEVVFAGHIRAFLPVFTWRRIRRGTWEVLARFLTGWRVVREKLSRLFR